MKSDFVSLALITVTRFLWGIFWELFNREAVVHTVLRIKKLLTYIYVGTNVLGEETKMSTPTRRCGDQTLYFSFTITSEATDWVSPPVTTLLVLLAGAGNS